MQSNNIKGARLLLEHNADVNKLQRGTSALYMAAVFMGNEEMTTLLLDNGATVTEDIKKITINDKNRAAISRVMEKVPNPDPQIVDNNRPETPGRIIK